MRKPVVYILLGLLAMQPRGFALDAEGRETPRPTPPNAERLQKMLQRFPEADANEDGALTIEEARTYWQQHRGQQGQRGNRRPLDARRERADSRVRRGVRTEPTHANEPYGPYERNVLDFWKAESPTPTPLVVYIHGGGFRAGDKSGADQAYLSRCLANGVSFAAINYRFRDTAPLNEIMRDIARAIQFLRFKAGEWNIDKTRIATYGGSAGAGSSLWLAFHDDLADPGNEDPVLRESTRLAAASARNPQASYDITRWPEILDMPADLVSRRAAPENSALLHLRDRADIETPRVVEARTFLDMLGHMDAGDPPVHLLSMGADVVPGDIIHHPRHAKAVKKRCDELGIEAALVVRDTPKDERIDTLDFLFEHLGVKAENEH